MLQGASRTPNRSRRLSSLPLLLLMGACCLFMAGRAVAAGDAPAIDYLSLNRSVAYLNEEVIASLVISAPQVMQKQGLTLRYYLDDREIGRSEVDTFDDSGNASLSYQFIATPEGRYRFRVELATDADGKPVAEVSRQLAILSLPGSFGGTQEPDAADTEAVPAVEDTEEPKPDIVASAITFDNPSPVSGQQTQINLTIGNQGTAAAPDVKVRVFINGQPYGDDRQLELPAGSEKQLRIDYQATQPGKKDILVLVNPDNIIDEQSKRNNLASKMLFVRPAPARQAKPAVPEQKPAASGEQASDSKRPNLVTFIETINDVHYSTDGQVRLFVSNTSTSADAGPSTIGVRRAVEGEAAQGWMLRKSIPAIAAGETAEVVVEWPQPADAGGDAYQATAAIDGKIDETSRDDNSTAPFRVVIITSRTTGESPIDNLPAAEILVTQPHENEIVAASGRLNVAWTSAGEVGQRIRLTVVDRAQGRRVFTAITDNDGVYVADLSTLPAGEYTLRVTTEDRKIQARDTDFSIHTPTAVRPVPVVTAPNATSAKPAPVRPASVPATQQSGPLPQQFPVARLSSPLPGSSWRGGQQLAIIWPQSIVAQRGLTFNIRLRETDSDRQLAISQQPVAASLGRYQWQVPDDATAFGRYDVELLTPEGKLLAAVEDVEFLPNFVEPDNRFADTDKSRTVINDLGIVRSGFVGPHFEIEITNYGPNDISAPALANYIFHTYFIRRLPVRSRDDLVICNGVLFDYLPAGDSISLSMGRNPDCALGGFDEDEKFIYAVTRFRMPDLIDAHIEDPKPQNNMSKYYWPEEAPR